jgi:hypothetical protein
MIMNVKYLVEWELAGETEVHRENTSQFHFVHHKYHMTWPGIESELPRKNFRHAEQSLALLMA